MAEDLHLQPVAFPAGMRRLGWRDIITLTVDRANEIVLASAQVRDWLERVCALQGIADINPANDERVALLVAYKIPGCVLWLEGRWHCSFARTGWDGRLPIYANTAALAVCRAFAAYYLLDASSQAGLCSPTAAAADPGLLPTPGESPIGDPPGFPPAPGPEQEEDITPETHALLVGLIARRAGGDAGSLVDAERLLECFYMDLERFVSARWYPGASRAPGWQESSGYYSYLLGAYVQLARAVCQGRLLADIGHLCEWEYLRRVAARDGYSISVAIEAALVLLQGEDRRFKEWYEVGFAYLNITIEPDIQDLRAICHLLALDYIDPDPSAAWKQGVWVRAAGATAAADTGRESGH